MDFYWFMLACAVLGCFAGLTAGLLGIGGGLLIVPLLSLLLSARGIDDAIVMQLALGTSLATIVFTALSSMRAHHRRGAVDWPLVWQLSAGILAGGWLGGWLALWIGGRVLAVVFGVFELLVAAQMAVGGTASRGRQRLSLVGQLTAGSVIGLLSALLGIGGGTLTVPYLVWHGIDMHRAVGTAAACGLPIALAGTAGFILAGHDQAGLPEASTGFVYWPAVAAISAGSIIFAPLGASLAHSLERRELQRLFAVFLAGLGVWMIIGR